ncbi:MAG: hypothetical protein RJA70_1104 [Pseudomonadota bacterium]|jgi:hypothetical protein
MSLTVLHTDLLTILKDARLLLEIPQNDFQYSPWNDRADALLALDHFAAELTAGQMPARALKVYFSATGPLQDVSMASGWQHQFVDLAVRADKLLNR